MGQGYYIVEISSNNTHLFIAAYDVESPESLLIELPERRAQDILNEFQNDYESMASSLQVMNKRLVLLNPVSFVLIANFGRNLSIKRECRQRLRAADRHWIYNRRQMRRCKRMTAHLTKRSSSPPTNSLSMSRHRKRESMSDIPDISPAEKLEEFIN